MIKRGFRTPNLSRIKELEWRSRTLGTENPKGGLRVEFFASERQAKSEFDRRVKEALAAGCVETERSLSRRDFRHPSKGKVWVISLDGKSHVVQFGKDPCWMFAQAGGRWGQNKSKEFPTDETARAKYHKLIDEKRREGYNEVGPRKTQYTSPLKAVKSAAGASRKGGIAGTIGARSK